MKQRLGGILCVILGAVLIGTGWSTNTSGDVGQTPVGCGATQVGVAVPCPTGEISFTKTVRGNDPSVPSTWFVRVTSTCLDPDTGFEVDQTVSVPSGGTASTSDLFVFSNTRQTTPCVYAFEELRVPDNCTSQFAPGSPVTLVDSDRRGVTLVNTCTVPTTPVPPTSTSARPTPTKTVITHSVVPSTSAAASTTAPISNTGPREQVSASVWGGVALCVLGLVLLVAGRRTGKRASRG
jgi:hypothetical protein